MGGAVRLRRTDVRNGSDYCRASIVFTVRLRRNTQSTRRSSATSTPRRGSPMSSPEYPMLRIDELLPWHWKAARDSEAAKQAA